MFRIFLLTLSFPEGQANCSDGIDNDGDGWVDELDGECRIEGGDEDAVQNSVGECDDGVNNSDGDTLIDGADPDCQSGGQRSEVSVFEQSECRSTGYPQVIAWRSLPDKLKNGGGTTIYTSQTREWHFNSTSADWESVDTGAVDFSDLTCFSTLVDDRWASDLQLAETEDPSLRTLWHIQYDRIPVNRLLFDASDSNGDGSIDESDLGRHQSERIKVWDEQHWSVDLTPGGSAIWEFEPLAVDMGNLRSGAPDVLSWSVENYPSQWLFGPGSWAKEDVGPATGCQVVVDYSENFDPTVTPDDLDPPYDIMVRYGQRTTAETPGRDRVFMSSFDEVEHLRVTGASCDPAQCVLQTAPIEPHPVNFTGFPAGCFSWQKQLNPWQEGENLEWWLYVAPHIDNQGKRSTEVWGANMNGWGAPTTFANHEPFEARAAHIALDYLWKFEGSVNFLDDGRLETENLAMPDGIQFDMTKWVPGAVAASRLEGVFKLPVDSNHDNVADWGYDWDGFQHYGLGVHELATAVDSKVTAATAGAVDPEIVFDSSTPWQGARVYDNVDAVEIEGYPKSFRIQNLDYTSGLSSALYHFQILTSFGTVAGDSYLNNKSPTEAFSPWLDSDGGGEPDDNEAKPSSSPRDPLDPLDDLEKMSNLFRLGLASAAVSQEQFAHAEGEGASDRNLYDFEEYRGGDLFEWGWLGQPQAVERSVPATPFVDLLTSPWSERINTKDEEFDLDFDGLLDSASEDTFVGNGFWDRCNPVPSSPTNSAVFASGLGIQMDVYEPCLAERELPGGIRGSAPLIDDFGVEFEVDPSSSPPSGDVSIRLDVAASVSSPSWASSSASSRGRLLEVLLQGQFGKRRQFVLIPTDGASTEVWLTFPGFADDVGALESVILYTAEEPGTLTVEEAKVYAGSADRWVARFDGGVVLLNVSSTPWSADVAFSGYSGLGFVELVELFGTQDEEFNSGIDRANDGTVVAPIGGVASVDVPAMDAAFYSVR